MQTLDLCVDAFPPGERFDPSWLPRGADLLTAPSEELALSWRRQWQPGQELRVRFLDGERQVQQRVRQHAVAWLEFANLAFDFGEHATAEIRVTFTGAGYWSHVGTDALRVPRDAPTMQLGGLGSHTEEVAFRRTVLHEFGHALGCIHEQASPAADIPWDVDKVYAFYRDWQGWDRQTTHDNVLLRYSAADLHFTRHDPASIMQYPVPETLTRRRFSVGWNDDLSDSDRSFITRMYPSRAPSR
jgi:hypothetical protein